MDKQNQELEETTNQPEQINQSINPEPTSQLGNNEKSSKKKFIKWGVPLAIVATIAAGVLLITYNKPSEQAKNGNQIQQQDKHLTEKYRTVYWTFEGNVDTEDRAYPTYKLWYKETGSEPKALSQIFGGDKDYIIINDTTLSVDGKSIFLRYDNKIEKVTIDNGDTSVIYSTSNDYILTGMSLNRDRTSLVISLVDNNDISGDRSKTKWDKYELSSEKTSTLYDGWSSWGLIPLAENEDGVWLVQHPKPTEGFFYGTLNPNTKALSEPEGIFLAKYSENGMVLSYDSKSEPNVCDAFSGQSPTAHTIINPFTNKKIGTISRPGKHVRIKEFSRDGKNILLLTKSIPTITEVDNSICDDYFNEDNGWQLEATDIGDSSPKIVANAGEAYKIWYPGQPNPYISYSNNKCTAHLLDGHKATSDCGFDPSVGILGTLKIN